MINSGDYASISNDDSTNAFNMSYLYGWKRFGGHRVSCLYRNIVDIASVSICNCILRFYLLTIHVAILANGFGILSSPKSASFQIWSGSQNWVGNHRMNWSSRGSQAHLEHEGRPGERPAVLSFLRRLVVLLQGFLDRFLEGVLESLNKRLLLNRSRQDVLVFSFVLLVGRAENRRGNGERTILALGLLVEAQSVRGLFLRDLFLVQHHLPRRLRRSSTADWHQSRQRPLRLHQIGAAITRGQLAHAVHLILVLDLTVSRITSRWRGFNVPVLLGPRQPEACPVPVNWETCGHRAKGKQESSERLDPQGLPDQTSRDRTASLAHLAARSLPISQHSGCAIVARVPRVFERFFLPLFQIAAIGSENREGSGRECILRDAWSSISLAFAAIDTCLSPRFVGPTYKDAGDTLVRIPFID